MYTEGGYLPMVTIRYATVISILFFRSSSIPSYGIAYNMRGCLVFW